MNTRAMRFYLSLTLVLLLPASARGQAENFETLAAGVARISEGNIITKIDVPEGISAVEIRLEIASPGQLDVDLFIYDADPSTGTGNYRSPICTGDGVGDTEICAVPRPPFGSLWIVIRPVGGSGKTLYRLLRNFVTGAGAGLVLARPISPDGSPVKVATNGDTFQFSLEEGEIAAVVLEGKDRPFSVIDEDGHQYLARNVGVERTQISVGKNFEPPGSGRSSEWLLTGFDSQKRFLIKIGAFESPYGSADARITVLRPDSDIGMSYMFAVSPVDFDKAEVGAVPLKLQRKSTGRPTLFRALGGRVSIIGRIFPEDYDIAICDQYGFVHDISGDEVLLNPRETSVRTSEKEFYFVVFPDPFLPKPQEAKFMLTLEPVE